MEQVEKAYEDFTAKFTSAHKDAMDAALKFNAMAVKVQGDFAKQQMSILETVFSASTRQVQLASETRDPAEFLSKNAEIVVGLNEKLVAAAQENFEMQAKVRDEFAGMVESTVKRATDTSAVVAKATKAPARKAA